MSVLLQIIIFCTSRYIYCVNSIKITTFNTHQVFTNQYASTIVPPQIAQIAASDSDVLCLQELYNVQTATQYLSALQSEDYSNSFSTIDIYTDVAPENLQTPRTPCDDTIINALNSTCMRQACLSIYTQSTIAYAACAATACPADYAQVIHTECGWCMAAIPTLQPSLNDFELAATFCKDPPPPLNNVLFNLTDGNAIVTKSTFPIVNTWSITLPSWLYTPRRLLIAEINICAETNPNNEESDCTDSIIVGCTLLDPPDYVDDSGIVQSPLLDNDVITSHNGLNRYQSQTIVNQVFNDNILFILGIKENTNNIFGVVLAGDINNGQIFARCNWRNEQGQLDADNCDINPSDAFDVWQLAGFVDAIDVAGEDVLCTWCADESSTDFNPWIPIDYTENPLLIPFLSQDSDKIMLQDGYCENYNNVLFQREFTEKIVNLPDVFADGLIPTSNHYGVSVNIEFDDNEGGRDDDKNCKANDQGDDDDSSLSFSYSQDSMENAMFVEEKSFPSSVKEANIVVKFDSSLWNLFCIILLFLCVNLTLCVCWYQNK